MFAHLNVCPTFDIHYIYTYMCKLDLLFVHGLTFTLSSKLTFNYPGPMDLARFKVTAEDNNRFGTR